MLAKTSSMKYGRKESNKKPSENKKHILKQLHVI